jgi:exonuclease VII small subunit
MPEWVVKHLAFVFTFSDALQAFKEAEALNRRVDEAFRELESAVQKALDEEDARAAREGKEVEVTSEQ